MFPLPAQNREGRTVLGLKSEVFMFSGFTDETLQFFLDLRFHNYTEYFHAEHDRYVENVQAPFYSLIEALGPEMRKIDPLMEIRPHKCLSRIHRDTRFTKDKSPYRDHLWFLFRRAAEPREKSLFYFGEFGPERLNWGMGIWGENREANAPSGGSSGWAVNMVSDERNVCRKVEPDVQLGLFRSPADRNAQGF